MNIHEYQAKALLRDAGAPVAAGVPIFSKQDIDVALSSLPGPVFVVKSQIHAGGRGKGHFLGLGPDAQGGVRIARSRDEVHEHANEMLSRVLVTKQTGPEGKQVNRLYLENGADIARELYLSLLVDRQTSLVSFVASTEGGMDIETVASDTPEKIFSLGIDPSQGLTDDDLQRLNGALHLTGRAAEDGCHLFRLLYRMFLKTDMSLLEINPMVVTTGGRLLVLDSKISFDPSALFRHPDIVALRDLSEEDEKEIEASKFDLAYVALEGNIGCMVNGAGLAMATMDIIKLYGADPANFLDVGGGASREKVSAAFKIITADSNVKGILVNIFGGIMRCDIIAEGIIEAIKTAGCTVPLVVRLEGTHVEQGKAIIDANELDVISAIDLDDAAQKIVNAVNGG